MILDGGANVSIGQKQLINIARSILQKPQIVLFNFAASAVDMRRRSELWRILFEELPTSTKFVATEEEQTLRRLEKVLMFHEGKVVEYGGTEKLLADPASKVARALKEKQERRDMKNARMSRG
jgi:ABC-type multidrug transport system fused ATPase/permease subunit